MNLQQTQALFEAWRDERLTGEQASTLNQLLRESEAARRFFRAEAQLHGLLHCAVANRQAQSRIIEIGSPARQRWVIAATVAGTIAATLIISTAMFLWFRNPGEKTIAAVKEIHGTVDWNSGIGVASRRLHAGDRVMAGTIVLEGDATFVQLRLDDGTLVSLNGNSELNFSDDGRKRLFLRSGTLVAEVKPQPKDRPMLVRTPAAELVVLGTQFTLDAEPTATALSVTSGSVSLRRLIDGEVIKVNAKQSVLAVFETSKLQACERVSPPLQWSSTYDLPPATPGTYRWLPASDGVPARLQAVPFVAGRRKDDSTVIHYGISLHSRMGCQQGLVTLEANTVIRFRYRLSRETPLECFLCCQRPDGVYAGNYGITCTQSDSRPDAGGWRWATVSLTKAHALDPARGVNPIGTQVRLARILSLEEDAGLEISETRIGPANE
jgi:ferric-dicitrate binding protein FerR (iron transport regulator)